MPPQTGLQKRAGSTTSVSANNKLICNGSFVAEFWYQKLAGIEACSACRVRHWWTKATQPAHWNDFPPERCLQPPEHFGRIRVLSLHAGLLRSYPKLLEVACCCSRVTLEAMRSNKRGPHRRHWADFLNLMKSVFFTGSRLGELLEASSVHGAGKISNAAWQALRSSVIRAASADDTYDPWLAHAIVYIKSACPSSSAD